MACCAQVRSSMASGSPRTRRAALRAAAARSVIVESGRKFKIPGSMLSVMPTSRGSSAVDRSDSLKASACAAAVL
eukprot:5148870-Pleurochrysis_carterae.AAC.1